MIMVMNKIITHVIILAVNETSCKDSQSIMHDISTGNIRRNDLLEYYSFDCSLSTTSTMHNNDEKAFNSSFVLVTHFAKPAKTRKRRGSIQVHAN